jgi:alpha-L-rhamnosidase
MPTHWTRILAGFCAVRAASSSPSASSSSFSSVAPLACAVTVTNLKVERRADEGVAIPTPLPRFSWVLEAQDETATNITQTGYQLQAYGSAQLETSSLLWDSGPVQGAQTLEIEFGGKPLVSEQRVWWRVRAMTAGGSSGITTTTTTSLDSATAGGAKSISSSASSTSAAAAVDASTDCTATSDWSAVASFRVGRLAQTDWTGEWIAQPGAEVPNPTNSCAFYDDRPNSLFRRTFPAVGGAGGSAVVDAALHITGLGYYVAFLNGQRIGESVLDPGFTTYGERVLYSTYDVTALLQTGNNNNSAEENVLAVSLGNGWWNPLPLLFWGHLNLRNALTVGTRTMLKLDLVVTFANGTRTTVVSSQPGTAGGWKTGGGPLLRNDIYLGNKYDARRAAALDGWTGGSGAAPFNDSAWQPAEAVDTTVTTALGPLAAQDVQPVEATEVLAGKLIHTGSSASDQWTVWDLGRNFAGAARVVFAGPVRAGQVVSVTYGEILSPDGNSVNALTSTAGQIKGGSGGPCAPEYGYQRDYVILTDLPSASDELVFDTEFTWHAFQYVQIDTAPGDPAVTVTRVEGRPLRSAVPPASTFHADAASAPHLDAIWTMALNTHAANMMSIQSDCPHRERFGYTGDLLASAETALLGFDMSSFYAKRARDVVEAQRNDGGITETAPYVGISDAGMGGESGPIGWDSVVLPLQLYLFDYYGDRRVMEDSYTASARWMEFLLAAPAGAVEGGLSDWMSTEPSPPALTGRAFLWLNLWSWARINAALGHADVAANFTHQAAKAAQSLNTEFLDPATGVYAKAGQFNATQCAQSMPLFYGITSEADAPKATQVRALAGVQVMELAVNPG